MRLPRALVMGLVGSLAMLPAAAPARHADPDKLPAIRVQDLHYGDVLFHYFSSDDLYGTLAHLEAYQHWQRMPHHDQDAALLAGSLYLSLGMHNEAGDRFATLLGPKVPPRVRNRAWFYLAKVWYARGYYDKTLEALGRISGQLSPELEPERQQLQVTALMRQGHFAEAAALLSNWQGPADWAAFARFNLGVALIRQDRLDAAEPVLTAVGTLTSEQEELLALRDKANLALGYACLQANQPQQALTALSRVRLSGASATKAMLGVGYAEAALGHFQEALVPWMELRQRDLLDAAVQESYLMVPYAFGKLGAQSQAADYYESAIKSFQSESGRIDAAIGEVGSGHMLDTLLTADKEGTQGWFWQLKNLPDAPQSRYLYALLADNDFQEGLKSFRDLRFLDGRLQQWQLDMAAFATMIDTRERAYAERVPRTDALLATDLPEKLRQKRTAIDAKLTSIETGGDVAALGTDEQRAQWARIRALEEALEPAAGDDASLDEARAKLRLIKGVLFWQLDESFKARVYTERHALRELDAALVEAQNRWVRVELARRNAPNNTGEFAARIASLAARIEALKAGLTLASQRQNELLQQLAQGELEAQKARLASYEVQARFALADIYDRSSSPPDTAAAPADAPAPDAPAPGAQP